MDSIQERLKVLREVEAERSKPRVVVKQVTIITLVLLGFAMLIALVLVPIVGQTTFADLFARWQRPVVLAWMAQREAPVYPVVGVSTPEQLEAAVEAVTTTLPAQTINALETTRRG